MGCRDWFLSCGILTSFCLFRRVRLACSCWADTYAGSSYFTQALFVDVDNIFRCPGLAVLLAMKASSPGFIYEQCQKSQANLDVYSIWVSQPGTTSAQKRSKTQSRHATFKR